jgi:hypothetical protein
MLYVDNWMKELLILSDDNPDLSANTKERLKSQSDRE